MLLPQNLLVEYKKNPLGMDEPGPRFSYNLTGDAKRQTSRRIVVKDEDGAVAWDSGVVGSSQSVLIEYEGDDLKPFTRYFWSVEVQDENGERAESKEIAFFETGFMSEPWTAQWINAGWGGSQNGVHRLIRDFEVPCKVVRARVYATALGTYDIYLNGERIGDDRLKPGWSDYHDHVQYQAYDITEMFREGANRFAVTLAGGWFTCKGYGGNYRFVAQVYITLEDGSEICLVTNDEWRRYYGYVCSPMRMSSIYNGEIYEAWEETDWMLPGGTLAQSVKALTYPLTDDIKIIWQEGPAIKRMLRLDPVSIEKRENYTWVVDFGQNFAGHEAFHLKNTRKGTTITIKHGEMLDSDGSVYTENLRSAWQRTEYTCGTFDDVVYEPSYTFYGFRYLEISGWPGEIEKGDIWAYAVYSELEKTGDFECSEPLLNQLYSNIVWGQRSNFVDVPTDCPQRDERQGWTGDTQVFANVATYNMSCGDFYTKWLRDLNVARTESGAYYFIAPKTTKSLDENAKGASGWSDAAIVCPDVMLRKYGDKRIVKRYLENMGAWLDWQVANANGSYIVDNALFGDWLNVGCDLDRKYISTAYLGGMSFTLARMAEAVGDEKNAKRFYDLSKNVKEAFGREYFTEDGGLTIKMQTAAVFALYFNLCPNQTAKDKAIAFLKDDIVNAREMHLSTGFLGTPLILKVLTEAGEVDLAYKLLMQTSYPGWLYSVTQGATTMWERWNSWTKEDGFGDPEMNSFNHYAYGAVGDWFFETICGIQPAASAFGEKITDEGLAFHSFKLTPKFGEILTRASASFRSPYGLIKSSWKRNGEEIVWDFTIPCNSQAKVILPVGWVATEDVTDTELPAGDYRYVLRRRRN